jgi:hypothetical protein
MFTWQKAEMEIEGNLLGTGRVIMRVAHCTIPSSLAAIGRREEGEQEQEREREQEREEGGALSMH